jgi:hypothetical protein
VKRRPLEIEAGDASGVTSEAELYDAASGNFESTGGMHIAPEFFTATLMSDGRVLVVGGFGFNAPTASTSSAPARFILPPARFILRRHDAERGQGG